MTIRLSTTSKQFFINLADKKAIIMDNNEVDSKDFLKKELGDEVYTLSSIQIKVPENPNVIRLNVFEFDFSSDYIDKQLYSSRMFKDQVKFLSITDLTNFFTDIAFNSPQIEEHNGLKIHKLAETETKFRKLSDFKFDYILNEYNRSVEILLSINSPYLTKTDNDFLHYLNIGQMLVSLNSHPYSGANMEILNNSIMLSKSEDLSADGINGVDTPVIIYSITDNKIDKVELKFQNYGEDSPLRDKYPEYFEFEKLWMERCLPLTYSTDNLHNFARNAKLFIFHNIDYLAEIEDFRD